MVMSIAGGLTTPFCCAASKRAAVAQPRWPSIRVCGVGSKELLGSPTRRGVDVPDRQEIVVADQAQILRRQLH